MKKLLITAMLFSLVASNTVIAQQGPGRKAASRLNEGLNLTEEQKTKMQELRSALQKNRIKTQADLRVARLELQELMQNDATAESKIKSQMEKISGYEVALKMDNVKFRKSFTGLLTDEQKEQLKALPAQRQGRRGDGTGFTGRQGRRGNPDALNRGFDQGRRWQRGLNRSQGIAPQRNIGPRANIQPRRQAFVMPRNRFLRRQLRQGWVDVAPFRGRGPWWRR